MCGVLIHLYYRLCKNFLEKFLTVDNLLSHPACSVKLIVVIFNNLISGLSDLRQYKRVPSTRTSDTCRCVMFSKVGLRI